MDEGRWTPQEARVNIGSTSRVTSEELGTGRDDK